MNPQSLRALANSEALSAIHAPDVQGILSAPSQLLMAGLSSVKSELESTGIELAKQAADSIMPVLTKTVSDMFSEIPMLGTAVSVVSTIIQGFFSMSAANEAANQGACMALQQTFPIIGSGPGGAQVPADIFAPKITGTFNQGPIIGARLYPSTLGQALAMTLEGAPIDGSDIDWRALHEIAQKSGRRIEDCWTLFQNPEHHFASGFYGAAKLPGGPYSAATFDRMADSIRHTIMAREGHPILWHGGPDNRHAGLFRAVRRAIKASYVRSSENGSASDGGIGLWPIYLDLLLHQVKLGAVNGPWLASALNQRSRAFNVNSWAIISLFGDYSDAASVYTPQAQVRQGASQTCASTAANWILSVADSWRLTVDPRYVQNQEKMAEYRAQAIAIAQRNAAKAKPRRVVMSHASGDPEWKAKGFCCESCSKGAPCEGKIGAGSNGMAKTVRRSLERLNWHIHNNVIISQRGFPWAQWVGFYKRSAHLLDTFGDHALPEVMPPLYRFWLMAQFLSRDLEPRGRVGSWEGFHATPAGVEDYLNRVNGQVDDLFNAMAHSKNPLWVASPPDFVQGWVAFNTRWKLFYSDAKSGGGCFLNCSETYDQTHQFEDEVKEWRKKWSELGGKVSTPDPEKSPSKRGDSPLPGPLPDSETVKSTVGYVVGGGLILIAALFVLSRRG